MDRKALLDFARSIGYKGAAKLADVKQFLADNGYDDATIMVGGKSVSIDECWSKTKTVTISVKADAGEDVQVQDAGAGDDPGNEDATPPPEVAAAASAEVKSLRTRLKALEEKHRLDGAAGTAKVIHPPHIRSERERAVKAYTAKAAREGRIAGYDDPRSLGTAFADGEKAEAFGACMRLKFSVLYPGYCGDYPQKRADMEIVKALGTTVNSLGGALVPNTFLPDLIELKERTGIMRGVIGVTNVPNGTLTVPRLGSDVSGAWVVEGAAISGENKPTFDNVSLSVKKFAVLVLVNRELINDSALNVGDIVARSMARRSGEAEDDAAINGDATATYGGIRGLISKLDSNAYSTAAGSTFAAATWAEIIALRGKLSDIAGMGEPSFLCSAQYFYQCVVPLLHAAGGQTMSERISGTNSLMAGGFRFDLCPKMPQTLPTSKIVLYCGWFSAGAKFGESGSMEVASSDQRYFEYDQIGFRATERVDINIHELGASGSNIVIAGLKMT